MSDEFLVRKGAAVPAATHPGDAARFHARRTIILPSINLHMTPAPPDAEIVRARSRPQRAARLTGEATAEKRKFTFRIDAARHAAFCRAAEIRNISRQRLLTEALDALLDRMGHAPDIVPAHTPEATNNAFKAGDGALSQHDGAAALGPLL